RRRCGRAAGRASGSLRVRAAPPRPLHSMTDNALWDTADPTRGQRMRLLDLTLPDPAENLALDEALLLSAEEGTAGEVLRLWEQPTYAVVVGSGGSVRIDVDEAACAAEGVPVL